MKTLTTITGKEIQVVSMNQRKRTATLRTSSGKYRTYPQSAEDFRSMKYWTGNDWQQFLTTNEYYKL